MHITSFSYSHQEKGGTLELRKSNVLYKYLRGMREAKTCSCCTEFLNEQKYHLFFHSIKLFMNGEDEQNQDFQTLKSQFLHIS